MQNAVSQLPTPDRDLLAQDLELLEQLDQHIKATERWLQQLTRQDQRVNWLKSLPGIGKIFAWVIVAEIDQIERFSTPKKLASYAGLVPSTYASGSRIFHGPLAKQGNKYLRWVFVEAVWTAICKSPWLRAHYERVKARHGSNGAKAAVARKLAHLVWHVFKEQQPYEERKAQVALTDS